MAEALAEDPKEPPMDKEERRVVGKNRRKRLHMFFIANNILLHGKDLPGIAEALLPALPTLAFCEDRKSHFYIRVTDLLEIWRGQGLLDPKAVKSIQDAATGLTEINTRTMHEERKAKIDKAAESLPQYHGEHGVKWFDLPAANWLSLLSGNPGSRIDPELLAATHVKHPDDPKIKNMVLALKREVELMGRAMSKEELIATDVDKIGQIMRRDDATGLFVPVETYYGWSKEFCEKVKTSTVPTYRPRSASSEEHKPSRFQSVAPQSRRGRSEFSHRRSRSPSRDKPYHRNRDSRSLSPKPHSHPQHSQRSFGIHRADSHHQTSQANLEHRIRGPENGMAQQYPYNTHPGQGQYPSPVTTQQGNSQVSFPPVSLPYHIPQSGMPYQPGAMPFAHPYQQNVNGAWPQVYPQMAPQNQFPSGQPMYGGQMPMNPSNNPWGAHQYQQYQGPQGNFGNHPYGGSYNQYNNQHNSQHNNYSHRGRGRGRG
jgi:hypothetical protein